MSLYFIFTSAAVICLIMDSPSQLSRDTEAVGRGPGVLEMTPPCRSGQSGRPGQGLSLPPPGAARSYRWARWPPAALDQASPAWGPMGPLHSALQTSCLPWEAAHPQLTGQDRSLGVPGHLMQSPRSCPAWGRGPGSRWHCGPSAAPGIGLPHNRCSVSASCSHFGQLGLLVISAGTGAGRLGPDAAPAAVQLCDLRPSAFQPSSPSAERDPQRGSARVK